jgi:photosystem II stability/assembly factor-like uncharacterized protein
MSRVFFVDDNNGWAVATGPRTNVFRTTDRGLHWASVNAPDIVEGHLADTAVIGTSAVFLAYTGGQQATVLRTSDGGQTWKSSTFRFKDAVGANLFFVNRNVGWLLLHTRVGMNHDWAEIFRTEDEGASWTRLTPDLEHSRPDNLSYLGGKSKPVFVDAKTGWIGEGPVAKGKAGLYRTTDGGTAWQAQELALPKDAENADLSVAAPQFFSESEGIVPVSWYADGKEVLSLFVTHDGGRTWGSPPPFSTGYSGPLQTYFSSAKTGWAWVGKPDSSVMSPVFQTIDGGHTWLKAESPVPHESVLQLDFVSPQLGWALVQASRNGQTRLLTTQDGGSAWTTVFPQPK